MTRYADIEDARERISGRVQVTPCTPAHVLSEWIGAPVLLKLENQQHTGSFKERGALNRLLTLSDAERQSGVITASAGNHAQGLAYHARSLGIAASIVMPVGTPLVKVDRTQGFGARVILFGDNYDEAFEHAQALAESEGCTYVHAYDDDAVIAGQGTIGLEIMDQVPGAKVIVVPVGGGGLIAGIAVAAKQEDTGCRIVGVEPNALPSMRAAIDAGHPVTLDAARSLADGIAVRRVGDKTFEVCKQWVDEWVTVDDDAVARAVLCLLEHEKAVAEGAGAAGLAALLTSAVRPRTDETVVIVVSGGNIDVNVVSRIIERGLVESGRMTRLSLDVVDRPGVLADVLECIARQRGNVVEVHHERAFSHATLDRATVDIVVETKNFEHADRVVRALVEDGYRVRTV